METPSGYHTLATAEIILCPSGITGIIGVSKQLNSLNPFDQGMNGRGRINAYDID